MRFLAGQTGGLETLAEHATDAGDGNHVLDLAMLADRLALGVVVGDDLAFLEQHCHRLADVLFGEREHALGGSGIERHADRRTAVLVDGRRGIDEVVATGNDFALEKNRLMRDRKSGVSGKSVSVRVDLGGRRIIKKKNKTIT